MLKITWAIYPKLPLKTGVLNVLLKVQPGLDPLRPKRSEMILGILDLPGKTGLCLK